MNDGSRVDPARRSQEPVRKRRSRAVASRLENTVGLETLCAYDDALKRLEAQEREAIICRVERRQNWDRVAHSLGDCSPQKARRITCDALCRMGQEMCGGHSPCPRGNLLAEAIAERSPVEWEMEVLSAENRQGRAFVEQMKLLADIIRAHWSGPQPMDHIGDFEVRQEIGRGGMGVVFEARQISLDRPVALKILSGKIVRSPESMQRFEREAKALAALNHPNIVTIHSVESKEGMHFIAMELVDGQSLAEIIPEGGLPLDRLLDLAIQMADALSSAHEHGITHRDLKPGNIMVNREGRVKVLDFGLAKLQEDRPSGSPARTPSERLDLTLKGALLGTVPYMSPEQTRQAPMDHRSDLFALGTTLYEMATGKQPFTGETVASVTRSILKETPQPVTDLNPDIHPELERIVAHCLRKNPDDRYQTAKGLRNELEELRLMVRSRELPSHAARKKVGSHRRLALVAAGAVLILATTAVILDRIRTPTVSPVPSVEKHLVVLPFTALGGKEVPTALTLGLTETLTARLSRLTDTHSLQIAHAAQGTEGPVSSVHEAGRYLGVNLAMVGSVQQYDPDLRVAIQLIDVQKNRQLGAQVIHATLDDPFDLQDRIVAAAIGMLELELQPREERELRTHGTGVAEANRLYLKGRGHLMDYSDLLNIDHAIDAFRLAIQKDTGYAQAHAGLGSAYWYKYDHTLNPKWVEQAIAACRQSVVLDEEQAAGRNCLGTVLVGTGRYLEAAAEFKRAASLEPTSDEALRGLGSAYQNLGKFEAAEETYRQAVALRPHYWATHNWLGAFYASRGRLDEAATCFRKVTELVPEGYRGYQNLGGVFLLQGLFEEARPVLEKSVTLKPSAGGYSNLATTWFALRQFEQAVQFNLKAIELGTRDFSVWGNLGEACYWAEGDTEKTRQAYRKAVELTQAQLEVNPSHVIALGELAKYHAMQGDADHAMEAIRRALELEPDNADTQLSAAIMYATLDRTDEALDRLEKSREAGMTSGWITANPVFDKLTGMDRFRKLLEISERSKL